MTASRIIPAVAALLTIAACSAEPEGSPGGQAGAPGDEDDTQPFSGIGADETIEVTGTEPFWGGDIDAGTFTYSTPENIDGEKIEVERFAGRGGLSFSGTMADGRPLDIMVTPGECSDGMSDRTYPFTVTLKLGEEQRNGCGYSEAQPFTEVEY